MLLLLKVVFVYLQSGFAWCLFWCSGMEIRLFVDHEVTKVIYVSIDSCVIDMEEFRAKPVICYLSS